MADEDEQHDAANGRGELREISALGDETDGNHDAGDRQNLVAVQALVRYRDLWRRLTPGGFGAVFCEESHEETAADCGSSGAEPVPEFQMQEFVHAEDVTSACAPAPQPHCTERPPSVTVAVLSGHHALFIPSSSLSMRLNQCCRSAKRSDLPLRWS